MSRTDDDIPEIPFDYEYVAYEGEYVGEGGFYYEEEEEESIYNSDDYISGPILSEKCTMEENMLEFDFSYGYNCRKFFNIVAADENTIVFGSGNFINFLDIRTKAITFRRSALGGGIGHISVNPSEDYHHLAIAENGKKPLIIIYEWPSMEINCILREGSSKLYSYIDYSPDGLLLVSQGGEPDYLITVFNWPRHRILLRTKSYVNDVFRVKFSPYVPGQLTSAGMGHIKFWKMANTFTGLKLKGELGRFGKTEYSDILGVLPMPDEKVVSGSYWGNILIWDAGLIKLEVFRSLRRKCHEAPIVQFFYLEGELWTVAMDGHVRVWSYEKIDQADPPDEDRVIQIEPIYDFNIPGVMLMSVKKRSKLPDDSSYFAQDGNGGLWIIDLNVRDTPKPPEQVYKCHGGAVTDIAACPFGTFLASIGCGKRLHLYNYNDRKLVFQHTFPAEPTCMIWLPLKVQKNGDQLVIGFDDGALRVIILLIDDTRLTVKLEITQITKPHNKPITTMRLNVTGEVFVTGSKDATIFIFRILQDENHITLEPIGYIIVPDIPTYLTWHHTHDFTLLVGCRHGHYVAVQVPKEPQHYTTISYLLALKPIQRRFLTYKSQIRRDIKLREIEAKKAEKVERKRKEMEKIKNENPGLEIDEEVFLADSESDEELEPLYIPEEPNDILWLQTTKDDTIWLSMSGYDAGYIYEYKISQKEETPHRFRMVDDADDIEINTFLYTQNRHYLIFAMQDGSIRINKVNSEDFRDLSDYWILPLHDNLDGFVSKMCFNHSETFLFTCGHDGNIFSYRFNASGLQKVSSARLPRTPKRFDMPPTVKDEDLYKALSLEETMVKAEKDRIQMVADEHKEALRKKIKNLETRFYKNVLQRNEKLLPSQKILQKELELDPRITEYIDKNLQAKLDLVKRKLAFDVEKSEVGMNKLLKHFIEPLEGFPIQVTGVNEVTVLKTIRQRKLAPEFQIMLDQIEEKIREAEIRGRPVERPQAVVKPPPPKKKRDRQLEFFLMSLSPTTVQKKLGSRLMRLLAKYRHRKCKWEDRQDMWDEFLAKKPQVNKASAEDEAIVGEAEAAIGDYKLKSAVGYRVPTEQRETTVKKYKELLIARQKQLKIRTDYNEEVYAMRKEKICLREKVRKLHTRLQKIHSEIPESTLKGAPDFPEDDGTEFPERNLDVVVEIEKSEDTAYPAPKKIVEPPDNDELELEILPTRHIPIVTGFDIFHERNYRTILEADSDELLKYSKNENKDTPWEEEMRFLRVNRKIFEQSEVVKQIEGSISNFNTKLKSYIMERQLTKVNGNFVDLHILFLHQQLIVLKEFESVEEALSEKVNQRMTAVLDMQDVIDEMNNKIEEHNNDIAAYNEKASNIQDDFKKATYENKFYDFLRKVFRKKYRPPKVISEDSSSESSSSSSSEESEGEDDAGSIDSRDFGIIKQDLNVCPKGCDPALYELAVSLRTERHQVEIGIREALKAIEILKKDGEISIKKMKIMQQALKQSQDELEEFQREKQQRLNKIRCTVVLKLDQIQNLDENNVPYPIENSLVFSKSKLTKLYKRVGELQTETIQQNKSHESDLRHLARMKTDCKYMEKRISQLKVEVQKVMLMKFGKVINLMEVEEALLKRTFGKDDISDLAEVLLKKFVLELRLSLVDVKGMYIEELKMWVEKQRRTQEEITKTLRENTARMELLALLNEERLALIHALEAQKKKKDQIEDVIRNTEIHEEENQRLLEIVMKQKAQMQELKSAIKSLKTKGLPAPSKFEVLSKKPKMILIEEEEESNIWADYERYVATEAQKPEAEKLTEEPAEIIMPFISTEAEEAAQSIIEEMLDNLGALLTRKSIENMVRDILHVIVSRGSIADIVNQLVQSLPLQISDEKFLIIETSAERLRSIQELEVTEDDMTICAKEIIEEVLNKVALETCDSQEFIIFTIENLLDQLPYEIVRKESSIDYISEQLKESLSEEFDKDKFIESLKARNPKLSQEISSILNLILQRVFGSGLDYLFYIK